MEATTDIALSQDQIATYQRDGVLHLKGAFADWVDPLRAGLERNLAEPGPFRCESTHEHEAGRFFDDYCNWERIPEYRDHVLESPAAALAGQAMQSTQSQFFHEHVFLKEPGTGKATPWHQDLPYYCVDGRQTVSVYIALDSMPEETTVRFAAGSHRWGKLFYPRHFIDGANFDHDDPDLVPVPAPQALESRHEIKAWALEPGDAVLFDFLTLHGTTAHTVTRRRRAFSTRWLGDDVTYYERPGETSPPYPDINLKTGERMREDWFPVVWRRGTDA